VNKPVNKKVTVLVHLYYLQITKYKLTYTKNMLRLNKIMFACICTLGVYTTSVAQEADTRGYNPLSVRPIHESDIMFKKTIWESIDLREKQNRPFMAVNNEITRFIFEAVKAGLLTPYKTDSVLTKLSIEEFIKNVSVADAIRPKEEIEADRVRIKNDRFLTKAERDAQLAALDAEARGGGGQEYPPNVFTQMELKEDVIFDKERSRLYFDIQALTIILPADKNADAGVDKPVASFKYKDLQRIFKNNPNAIYFNAQNNAAHKNLSDAFDLRLFSGRIVKISNPNDEFLIQVYEGDRKGLLAADWIRQQLMEFEHNLWEF
jgi:gliding motility associated protien GldN